MKMFLFIQIFCFLFLNVTATATELGASRFIGKWLPEIEQTLLANKKNFTKIYSGKPDKISDVEEKLASEIDGIFLEINEKNMIVTKKGYSEIVIAQYDVSPDARILTLDLKVTEVKDYDHGKRTKKIDLSKEVVKKIQFFLENKLLKVAIHFRKNEESFIFYQYFSKHN